MSSTVVFSVINKIMLISYVGPDDSRLSLLREKYNCDIVFTTRRKFDQHCFSSINDYTRQHTVQIIDYIHKHDYMQSTNNHIVWCIDDLDKIETHGKLPVHARRDLLFCGNAQIIEYTYADCYITDFGFIGGTFSCMLRVLAVHKYNHWYQRFDLLGKQSDNPLDTHSPWNFWLQDQNIGVIIL
jgi:hypothetical protein|tara:strand:+ start:227 stop:778 length:552 start_codon:yes stop_codon:yes gene_type:complete